MENSYTVLSDGNLPTKSPANGRRPITSFLILLSGSLLVLLMVALVRNHGGPEVSVAPATFVTMSRGVSEGVSEKANREFVGVSVKLFPWSNTMLSWQRTGYHFQPEQNYMSDPSGPMYREGWYHFFYQYNPRGAVWGNIVWGHAVSKDLVNWFHLPFALAPGEWYDIKGTWTGSATLLPDGQVIILYTGSTIENVQLQNRAYPANLSDPLLVKWVKYPDNPVMAPPPGIGIKDFRDPTTGWVTHENKWRILIGSKIKRAGVVLIYDTVDFINFEKVDGLLHAVEGTGMWECVDFYPVSKNQKIGLDNSVNGSDVKYVLKASMDDTRIDYYAIGDYDPKNNSWVPDNPKIDVGYGQRYDYGTCYASKTFYDRSKERRILWGSVVEADTEAANIAKGWATVQSIPRSITLDQKTGTNLILWPIEEIETLRTNMNEFINVKVPAGSILPLNVEQASQLDIMAEFEINKDAFDKVNEDGEDGEEYSCVTGSAAKRGALGPFGFLLLADEHLTEQSATYFYITKKDGRFTTFFCSDQTRSSLATDVVKGVYGSVVPVLNGEKFSMRILVDHSIIESFSQGGRTCVTCRVYPTKAIYDASRVFLFNNATSVNVTASIKMWHLNSAVIRPYVDQSDV